MRVSLYSIRQKKYAAGISVALTVYLIRAGSLFFVAGAAVGECEPWKRGCFILNPHTRFRGCLKDKYFDRSFRGLVALRRSTSRPADPPRCKA